MPVDTPNSVVDVLDRHVGDRPERIAYRFLADGDVEGPIGEWSFLHVERRARGVGAVLRDELPPGSRVLLLYPAGLEFVAGFLGCVYAGVVAVPAHLPDMARPARILPRLARIAADCGASGVLTTRAVLALADRVEEMTPELAGLRWHATDASSELPADDRSLPGAGADDIAFLQYTSGSTGTPKGVMVTHANLMHNLRSHRVTFAQDEASRFVSWLPVYHDMGLVGGLLYPLLLGATATLMSPAAFVQRPLRWLEAISRFGGTFSVAPNFAYDLCVAKSADTALATLDLSSWAVAGNGSEPVRRETMDRFADRFAVAGFRRRSFTPCYGLAEGTLLVTSVRPVDAQQGDGDPRQGSVSCGRPSLDTEEDYSKPHSIEKKNNPRAASNASRYVRYGRR